MPSIADPTQSVVVFVLRHCEHGITFGADAVLFVIRTTTLVRYMSLTNSSSHIPWDDWKGDTMIVDIPRDIFYVQTFVCGTRVLLMFIPDHGRGDCRIQAYDFSLWGCRALVRVGNGKEERRVMPNPEKVWCPSATDAELKRMKNLGDSLVVTVSG